MTNTDGRRARGDRTRQRIAVRAAELASVHGLSALTLGQLADDLGIRKSSVAAAFGTKEQLQLAAVDAAAGIFLHEVIEPAAGASAGLPRLRALTDAWLAYVRRPVFPGGCFMVATAAEFDSRPGVVRDALSAMRRDWVDLLAYHVKVAQQAGALLTLSPAATAFEIDAILAYAGVAANLVDDSSALDTAREVLRVRLDA